MVLFALLWRGRLGQLKFFRQVPTHFVVDDFFQGDIGYAQTGGLDNEWSAAATSA